MIPKLLVSIDDPEAATPRFHPPDLPGRVNVVLKIEPPEYRGLLDLEALCLRIHRDAGFATPDWWRIDHKGLRLLAVARFDRRNGRPLPMESLFSVIATGDHRFRETADILLEELGDVIARLGQVAHLPGDAREHLYRRLLLALLTGNGDLHLDNLSLLGGLDDCRWSPVYDPAPMRAWPRHDLISAIPFDASAYPDHGAFFLALGGHFGLSAKRVQICVGNALAATEGYADAVMALPGVPETQRRQLRQITLRERALLQSHL
jgi:serine/threonine-protein kinase HipA